MGFIIQYFLHLLLGNSWKPIKEFRYSRTIAQVLKERRHRDARAAKAPRSAQNVWRPFHRAEVFEGLRVHASPALV